MLPQFLREAVTCTARRYSLCYLAGTAHADDSDVPIRHHNGGVTVIMQSSMKPIVLVAGDNIIGKARSFDCKSSAGCVVLMNASIQETNGGSRSDTICNLVDGIQGVPSCTADPGGGNPTLNFARQQLKVGPGLHTITTIITAGSAGFEALSWEEDYTIYERKVKGTD
jgi:hypothetical protein